MAGLAGALAATVASAALDVSMSIAPTYANPINPGDVTAFRITLTNSNTAASVTGAAFTNTLPAGLRVAGVGLKAYTCTDGDGNTVASAGTVNAAVGAGVISLSGGSIPSAKPSGASGRCDIDVEVTSTVRNSSQLNEIPAGAVTGNDGGAVANGTPAQQTVTVNNMGLPVIGKSFSASNVVKDDQTVRLTLTIGNANNPSLNLPLHGVGDSPAYALRDVLPPGLEVAAAPNATVNCPGGTAPSFNPAAGATTLEAVGGVIAAGGACTLAVDLVGVSTGGGYSNDVTNTIDRASQFFNRRGLVPAQNATANLSIRSVLRVSKSFSPGTVAAGQQSNLTITLTNASPVSAITLDPGDPFIDSPIDGIGNAGYGLKVTGVPTTTCVGGVVAKTAGDVGIQLTGGTIAANSSCTITVPFTGTPQTPGQPQAFTNTVAQGAVKTTDPDIVSQPASASVNVVDQLLVSKTSSPSGAIAPGSPVRYTVTVSNYSAGPLTNLAIHDPLPAGMTALLSSPAAPALSGSCAGLTHNIGASPASPTFTVASVSAGSGASPSTCTVTFWAMTPKNAAVGADFINQILAGGVTADGGITNYGVSTGATLITAASAVTVNKGFNPASADEGAVSQLTVTFTNVSAQQVTGASFTDPLPVGSTGQQLIVASPANASTTCVGGAVTAAPGASSVSMSGATIPARAGNGTGAYGTCTLTVSVVGAAGSYQNTLPAGALTGTETYADGTTHTASSPGPVTATLTYTSALTATKAFSPTTVTSGGASTVTVQLGNVGDGTLNNVSVTDPLPTGMVVASPANAYTTCGGAPVVTAVPGASTAGLAGAVIPAGGKCNLLFNVTATGAGNWSNAIPAGNISADGGVRNVAPVTATLTNSSAGGVSVTNNTSPNSLTSPGQTAVLTLTLNNGGSISLSGLGLTDYFTVDGTAGGALTGMVAAAAPNGTTTCPGGVVTAAPDGTQVTLSGATLAAGGSCTVTVNVTLRTTGTVQNVIPAGAIATAQGVSNTLPTTTSLSAGSNIGVTKRFTPAVVKPGERSRLQITFINPISLALTNLAATDNLPAGVEIPAGPNPTTTCTGATIGTPTATQVSVSGGTLPPAANGVSAICVVEIDVVAAAAGTYNNVIGVGQVTGMIGGGSANNPVAAPATLEVRTPATLAKAFNPTAVGLGVPTTVTLTLNNPNSIPLTAAALADALPSGLTVALTPNASTTCVGGVVNATASATSVSLTGGTLPAGGSCTVRFDALSNVAGVFENTIPAGALATQQGVTNENPATATVRIIDPPTISKQFSPASIPAGGVSALTLVLGNTNATAATLTANLDDILPTSPAPILVASPNGLAGTCTLASVTANPGGGTVRYASGASIPAGGCTIVVNVTGATEGTYTNVIPVGGLKTNLGDNILPTNADLVISPLGYISGRVFKDNDVNPNGTFEIATDATIAGATIILTGTDYGADGLAGGGDDNAVNRTTATDTLGNYGFTGLNPGAYTVTEPNQPTGTQNGITTAGAVSGGGGGTIGSATAVSTTPSVIANIVLLKNGGGVVASSPGNNFAEVQTASIGGTIFLDQDDNGVRNAADTALAGVTVELLNGGGSLVATTTTDAAGAYLFTGLTPGPYTVREPAQPTGTANGKTLPGTVGNGGAAGTATAQSVTPSQIAGLVLPPATASVANNFAEVPAGRQIGGRVFVDDNDDGIFNGADTPLSGVRLDLTGNDFNGQPVTRGATTTADGRYVFTGLAAGTYTVTEPDQPPETRNGKTVAGSTGGLATASTIVPSAISGVDLTGTNTISTANDFAEIAAPTPTSTSIAGRVYVDLNDNGVFEAGEPGIGDVPVRLTGTDANGLAVDRTGLTNADGGYLFDGLSASGPDGYTVTETQPSAYGDGKTTIGSGDPGVLAGGKPVAGGGGDVINRIVLAAGQAFTRYDFGERRASAGLSGYVFVDADNDGVRDAGEAGIPDVVVRLTGTDISGAAVDLLQSTGADGAFRFDAPASNAAGYRITEGQPGGYNDGKTAMDAANPGAIITSKPVGVGDADEIAGVVLGVGQSLADYRFGEIAIPSLKRPLVNGYVYLDRTHTRQRPTDGSAAGQPGWTVVLRQNDVTICTTTTDANGFYQFDNLHCPGYEASGLPTGSGFSISFDKDGNNLPNVPTSGGGRGVVPPTGGIIQNITLVAADVVVEQNLPLDPAGVVYDAVTRRPTPDAVVVISGPAGFDPAVHLVGGALAATQTTGTDGLYQFLLQNGFPSGIYTLTVTAPDGYLPAPSSLLPPCTATLNVGLVPTPALIQGTDLAPGQSTPIHDPAACIGLVAGGASSTQYYFRFAITNGGSAPILNNHIPLDPITSAGVLVTKTTPLVSVGRGGLVPYTITATNPLETALSNVSVRDQLPPGFKFREGSASRNGQAATPIISGSLVAWPAETFAPKEKKIYSLVLVVGSGVGDGDYVNRAWLGAAVSGAVLSNTATATVRIVPDPTFDCPDIIGKVFDDKNANGYQDDGEPGIPAVRMATPNGLLVTSDAEGRFHVPCPAVPNPDRGSNFVMKLDERTLPSGFRVTTENPRDVRITRGKMVKLNFGATVHRVVRVELADAAFEVGGVDLLADWRAQLEALPDKLKERPSIVRIAYGRGVGDPGLAKRRVHAVREQILRAWKAEKDRYALVVEIEGEQ